LSQFTTKRKASNEDEDDTGAGDWIDTLPVDEMDDEELEAANEVDKDRQASDNAEIQDISRDVDFDSRFFVSMAERKLGEGALLKVCKTNLQFMASH
jgi:hypothetical protein